MTLAALFLLLSALAAPSGGFVPAQDTAAQQSSHQSASQKPEQTNSHSQTEKSSAQSPKTAPESPKTSSRRRRSRKKLKDTPCLTAGSGSKTSSELSPPNSADQGAPASTTSKTAKDCPPPRIIVRKGGTTEPSIQLAGGSTAEQAAKRDAINQALGTTEQNLQKAAAMQLNTTQQDTVSQTRQFVEQSKAAMADGDLERAKTLAWKAQLLSEDLVNPAK